VVAPGFIGKGMTIRNTAGPEGEQAVALRAGGDQQAFSNVNLEGYQVLLYPSRHTLKSCKTMGFEMNSHEFTTYVPFGSCPIRYVHNKTNSQ